MPRLVLTVASSLGPPALPGLSHRSVSTGQAGHRCPRCLVIVASASMSFRPAAAFLIISLMTIFIMMMRIFIVALLIIVINTIAGVIIVRPLMRWIGPVALPPLLPSFSPCPAAGGVTSFPKARQVLLRHYSHEPDGGRRSTRRKPFAPLMKTLRWEVRV